MCAFCIFLSWQGLPLQAQKLQVLIRKIPIKKGIFRVFHLKLKNEDLRKWVLEE